MICSISEPTEIIHEMEEDVKRFFERDRHAAGGKDALEKGLHNKSPAKRGEKSVIEKG